MLRFWIGRRQQPFTVEEGIGTGQEAECLFWHLFKLPIYYTALLPAIHHSFVHGQRRGEYRPLASAPEQWLFFGKEMKERKYMFF
jgi:hypothetical protein